MGGNISYQDKEASVVTKTLLYELTPRFRLPLMLESNNSHTFMAKVSTNLSKVLNIDWEVWLSRKDLEGNINYLLDTPNF